MSLPAATFLQTQQTAIYVVPAGKRADVVSLIVANQSTVSVDVRLYVDLGNGQNRPIAPQPVTLHGGDKYSVTERMILQAGHTLSGIATAAEAIHAIVMGTET